MAEHDSGYKLLFSHPGMVEDLLRGFVHEEWVERLDFSTLEKVGASYVAEDLQRREDDLLWRLRLRGKGEDEDEGEGWLYLYLLFEFQSTVDRFMAVRLMAYVALLYQDLIRRDQLTPSGRLPPVVPIVLYNGEKRWRAARQLARLIEPLPGGLAAFRPQLFYLLLDEGRLGEAELSQGGNLSAALFRLERSRTPEQVARAVDELRQAAEGRDGRVELLRVFAVWVRRVLLPGRLPGAAFADSAGFEEVTSMLEETVRGWTEELLRQGRREGHRKGRREGLREGEARVLSRQMERKFGVLADQVRERIAAADAEQILAWSERLLTARTLDEVFED